MSRQEAHELLRRLSTRCEERDRSFKEILIQDQSIGQWLSEREIDEALDPRNYVGTALEQVELLIAKTTEERRERGVN
jgi:adenylosuccinate lyase